MPAETATAIVSVLMGGILEQFPRLKFCFAHGGDCFYDLNINFPNRYIQHSISSFVGGSFPFTIGRIEHGYKVRPDLCATDCDKSPRSFLGKIWTDSLVHDVNAIKLLVDVIGQVYNTYIFEYKCLIFGNLCMNHISNGRCFSFQTFFFFSGSCHIRNGLSFSFGRGDRIRWCSSWKGHWGMWPIWWQTQAKVALWKWHVLSGPKLSGLYLIDYPIHKCRCRARCFTKMYPTTFEN